MKIPFSVMIFFIEVGSHHIYDDTWFCQNYHHKNVISMTEKNCSAQNVTDVSFFIVRMNGDELILSGPMSQLETDRWIQNMEDHVKNNPIVGKDMA